MKSPLHYLVPAIVLTASAFSAEETHQHRFKDAAEKYSFTIDTTGAKDLTEWVKKELTPVVQEWYPKIVEMLPSEGYEAPKEVSILFRDDMKGIPAYAMGNRVSCNIDWYKNNLTGEAKGCTVHELVHVVQQYGRRPQGNAVKFPGWLVEGIPDYIRWFLYEPQSRGAEISQQRADKVNFDQSYRVSANFLNWVTKKHPGDLIKKLNAVAREGKYEPSFWNQLTGKSVEELGTEWKRSLGAKETPVAAPAADGKPVNVLTEEENKAGWILLFNGKDLTGWNNFKTTTIKPGWQVKDGTLACVDPHNASDLCTKDQYDWFELELEYNISEGGNSGIIFHATDDGGAVWATGPEFQLEDNAKAKDPQRCGWLYGLYKPEIDPATGKILDATKPAGEWNHVRLLVSPEKCEHVINGVSYFSYQLGSEDFKKRVAASKFGQMPLFAKFNKGYLALQGDHGQVSFRNIKLKPIAAK